MNLNIVELKPFVPAKDFQTSIRFYEALGFTKRSEGDGVAYFLFGNTSFLLQDFYQKDLAENYMLHFLVENVDDWNQKVLELGLDQTFDVKITSLVVQPWRMKEFCITDPSGVLLRFAQNV